MAAETTIMWPSSRSAARPALLSHLLRTVRQQQLFVPGQHLLVAVSGGPDSVALLSPPSPGLVLAAHADGGSL